MDYENEREIDNLLLELNIDILDIDDGYTPTDEDITYIFELYDIY